MRLGINFGYQDWSRGLDGAVALAQEADRLGFHSGGTAEAYGTAAIAPPTWLMAHTGRINFGPGIMPMPARTPAMARTPAASSSFAASTKSGSIDSSPSSTMRFGVAPSTMRSRTGQSKVVALPMSPGMRGNLVSSHRIPIAAPEVLRPPP